ncbi:MAG: hypothetical protein ACFCUQ_02295 [Kiloniellales bacterium]
MTHSIRNSIIALSAIALVAGLQAGAAEARGGARELNFERAHAAPVTPPAVADRQKAAIKDPAASDADSPGWFDSEWFGRDQNPDRPNSLLNRRKPAGR